MSEKELLERLLQEFYQAEPWYRLALRASRECCEARADPAHDIYHVTRVVTWGIRLWLRASCTMDLSVIVAAALFHDAVVRRKNDPLGSQDTRDSAILAREILTRVGFPLEKLDHVCGIVDRCSYSKHLPVHSPEEMVVRDADMLECLGPTGITRYFVGSGMMNRPAMDLDQNPDPIEHAAQRWVIETIERRAKGIEGRFYTQEARDFAREGGLAEFVYAFLHRYREDGAYAMVTFTDGFKDE